MSAYNLVVLQARMSSTRFPGKVMMKINNRPMIYWQVQRILKAKRVHELVVATSADLTDDVLANFLEANSITVHRGSLDNVFSRFIDVGIRHPHDTLIRLTGDCPLVMPELIDQMVDVFYEQNVEYLSNTLEPTFPDGLDVEIMQCGVLEKLATFKLGSKELEHVTYGVCARPEIFKLSNFRNESDFSRKRWTVDYQEDFEFVSRIYRQFAGRESEFTFTELCDFLQENPTIETLNHTYRRNLEINSKKSQGQ